MLSINGIYSSLIVGLTPVKGRRFEIKGDSSGYWCIKQSSEKNSFHSRKNYSFVPRNVVQNKGMNIVRVKKKSLMKQFYKPPMI